MNAAACDLETVFEAVEMRVETGRTFAATESLASQGTLREVPLLANASIRGGIRAFRAHGDGLRIDGVRDGDLVIVDAAKTPSRGTVVVASIAGRLGIGRVQRNVGGTVELAPANPDSLPLAHFAREADVLGALAGVIRKQGFGSSRSADRGRLACESPHRGAEAFRSSLAIGVKPPGRLSILRGKLGMLESTCATTRNPRLRRALHNEADRVRRLLQNEPDPGAP